MPPAQKPTGAEGAARALPREQPVTAAAVTPTPVNNESAGAEGAEFIAQDLSQDPPGNDDLLQQAIFMRVLITRYPASEDRLIVRPLLCRRCALRLQPAEPQPYNPPPDS